MITDIIKNLVYVFENNALTTSEIGATLLMIAIMSIYEFIIYRLISNKYLYNKSFHIAIMVIPFFIGAIIRTLQSDLILTLGTIGALAIIRFRTAVKNPVDMVYILWSVFIGITCGCELYELCLATSVIVTIILLLIDLLNKYLIKKPYVLVINTKEDKENLIVETIKPLVKNYRIKSRNYTNNGIDYIFEVSTKDPKTISQTLQTVKDINKFSLIEFDTNDII